MFALLTRVVNIDAQFAVPANEDTAISEGGIHAPLNSLPGSGVEKEEVDSVSSPLKLSLGRSDIPGSTKSVGAETAYARPWKEALQPQLPKRRVVWVPAAVAVAVTVVIVMTVALVLSGKRSGSKPAGSESTTAPVPPSGMVYVRGGEFAMGNDAGDEYERPAHKVAVKSFYIDIHEVTCEDYQAFVQATGHKVPANWVTGNYPPGQSRKPVTGVDWYDATAYAAWAKMRLPTEEEWEFAARGTDGRRYSWGNEWRANAGNADDTSAGGLVDVGTYPNGKSQSGTMDMIGNAWEWTLTDLKSYPGGQIPTQPLGEFKIIRGGSWKEDRNQATVTYRGYLLSRGAKDYTATGFRCAADIENRPSVRQP